MSFKTLALVNLAAITMCACQSVETNTESETSNGKDSMQTYIEQELNGFAEVKLSADLSTLSENEKKMLPILIHAAEIMDDLYWKQSYPWDKDSLLNSITDSATRAYVNLNYGPWEVLHENKPFIPRFGPKPLGAGFYPVDITKEEFEKSDVKDKHGQYSLIKRDSTGKLYSVPFHEAYKDQLEQASGLIKEAAALAEDPGLKKYLTLRAQALVTDDFTASDLAWMDMTDNGIDIIIGPIESYEDKLYGNRNAYEAYVLIKDKDWSDRLKKYVGVLPELQAGLPVDDKYKKESPGTSSQLVVYNVVYYAGHCNSGGKTIAVNLPNDEVIQNTKGTRRSQLKNAVQAKFDKIMKPIANDLIDPSQVDMVQFDPFFSNVMFHEVAHGLGIKNTIDGKGTVREALAEQNSWLEEAKADILGLYMVTKLVEKGELPGPIENYYATFMAGILRSVRFGATEAHGQANMLEFNFFQDKGAFEKTSEGHYKVDFAKFKTAMTDLSNLIITLQGNGDKPAVTKLQQDMAVVRPELQQDLSKLQEKGIPVDVVFDQGTAVLGLQ